MERQSNAFQSLAVATAKARSLTEFKVSLPEEPATTNSSAQNGLSFVRCSRNDRMTVWPGAGSV